MQAGVLASFFLSHTLITPVTVGCWDLSSKIRCTQDFVLSHYEWLIILEILFTCV